MSCVNACNSCCDKCSAEFGEHVFEGGFVLVGVPGLVAAAAGEVVGVVAVQGSGTEASAELHLGVELSLNRRCFVILTARSRQHADHATRITDATQVKLRNSSQER